MTFLKEAATRYIQDIADGSKRLAIITFSNDAAVRHTLMPVNVNTRQSFLNTVKQLRTVGATCIGCGLLRALEVRTTFASAKYEREAFTRRVFSNSVNVTSFSAVTATPYC